MESRAYAYLVDLQQSVAHRDALLAKTATDIGSMEARIKEMQERLAAAEQFATVLAKSLANDKELIASQCELNGWVLPPVRPIERAPQEPSAAERKALAASTSTQGIPLPPLPDDASGVHPIPDPQTGAAPAAKGVRGA